MLHMVAEAELRACFQVEHVEHVTLGPLDLIEVDLPSSAASGLMRLSWVQAIFEVKVQDKFTLSCLDVQADYQLPAALVWGQKYRGKPHELVTQLAINLVLSTAEHDRKYPTLLDPMAGHGTTLLWAARYGINAYGVELEPQSIDHFERDVKRQTKLHRIKHSTQHSASKKGKKEGVAVTLNLLGLKA